MKREDIIKKCNLGGIFILQDRNAAVLFCNEKEEINLQLYKSQDELLGLGMLGGYINTLAGKKNEILYAGQLKDFDKLNYTDRTLDEKLINHENQKIYHAIYQLGGHMESYFMVFRYYLDEKNNSKISLKQARDLVKRGEAEFKKYKRWDLLSYHGELLWRYEDNEGVYFK